MPGSAGYLCSYNTARRQVERKLTDNQRQMYKAMAKEWSEKKLPPRMQQRMMSKHGPRAIKEFTSSAYKQFGMHVVVLAAFMDGEGDSSATLSDDEPARKHGKAEIKLKRNKDGYPMLPSREYADRQGLTYKKRLIGKFMADLLRQLSEISTGVGNGKVPYAELQRAQGDYIKPKYLPKKVTLKQYYHLRQDDVNAILDHWTKRQADGKVPLSFKKEAKAIQQKKCTSEENSSDAEMGEEAEGDLNDSTEEAHPGQSLGNAAKNPSGRLPRPPDDGQGAAQPGAAAGVHAQQQKQTGGGVAPDLSHSYPPPALSPSRPLNHPLADGSRAGQIDGASTEDEQSRPASAGQETSPNNEVESASHERQPLWPSLPSAADEEQRPPPGSLSAADEDQQPLPGLPSAVNGGPPPPPASRGASLEMQGGGHHRCRSNEDAAADSPLGKRWRVDRQVDGTGLNTSTRRSNRDRRPTTKAAGER
ncbi:hypothetical protein V8E52_003274 [Russula decolorans]